MTMETEFEFADLSISLCGKTFDGMLLSGIAMLEGDEDGFSVRFISLDDGPDLRKGGNGALGLPAAFEDEFFRRIASVIENPKTAVGSSAEASWRIMLDDEGHSPDADHSTINREQLGLSSAVARV